MAAKAQASPAPAPEVKDFDILIIGAGISGINFAYRVQERLPTLSYAILDARDEVGGTWSLFKYPGIRSDSDLYTFGFPWRPWKEQTSIAEGALIRNYLEESAAMYGIDKHIHFKHTVNSANWSTPEKKWTVDVTVDKKEQKKFRGQFILFCTGYYDYFAPLEAVIPGIKGFKGQVIHPQFWPEDLDFSGKEIAVIGSGATAVTLLPNLAAKAKHVTMVQRSPSYLLSVPKMDGLEWLILKTCPTWLADKFIRAKWLVMPFLLVWFCVHAPNLMKRVIRRRTQALLPPNIKHDPHFKPSYNPFEQRLCLCPDGDFYKSLRQGKASIETGNIETITEDTIKMVGGNELHPDIIVTATGLKLLTGGGVKVSVDGKPYKIGDHFMWKGVMLENLPNAAYTIGYVDASWTLGADATAQMFTRIIKEMKKEGVAEVVPRQTDADRGLLKEAPVLRLTSTYVKKGMKELPKSGNIGPWRPRSYYFKDILMAWYGDIHSGMEWVRSV